MTGNIIFTWTEIRWKILFTYQTYGAALCNVCCWNSLTMCDCWEEGWKFPLQPNSCGFTVSFSTSMSENRTFPSSFLRGEVNLLLLGSFSFLLMSLFLVSQFLVAWWVTVCDGSWEASTRSSLLFHVFHWLIGERSVRQTLRGAPPPVQLVPPHGLTQGHWLHFIYLFCLGDCSVMSGVCVKVPVTFTSFKYKKKYNKTYLYLRNFT